MTTKIQWSDETWNPLRGGLVRLTAEGKPRARWNGTVRTVPERLGDPLRWRKPRMVFVNSMSDLFHESVPFEYIAAVFGVMAAAPQHTFQVLTKRPERAREFFAWIDGLSSWAGGGAEVEICIGTAEATDDVCFGPRLFVRPWPLPNVWLGVSVEDPPTAERRISELLHLPAAVRWVSYEPALAGVDFAPWLPWAGCDSCGWTGGLAEAYEAGAAFEAMRREPVVGLTSCPACGGISIAEHHGGLDWIVIGGESGHGARPFDLAWARQTIAQCREAGVPVFVKQVGAWPYLTGLCNPGPSAYLNRCALGIHDRKGGDPSKWPEDLRVREWPREASGE